MTGEHASGRITSLGVLVLALLREGDLHPYEMMRLLRQRRKDRLVALSNGTFYHTVARLERWGLVAELGTDRDGNRPERTTYTLTDEGSAVVEAWVRAELPRLDRPAEFRVALAEAHNLPRDEVIALLSTRRALLAAEREEYAAVMAGALDRGAPEQVMVEVDRHRALADADVAWTDRLLARLASDDLPWGFDDLRGTAHHLDREKASV